MCRWLAYSGEPLVPAEVILNTEHSLVAQSLNSPLGKETVNGDGFGFGWYPTGTPGANPALFHSTEPAWNDENLRELTSTIESPLFFSHVRAAAGPPIQQSNCHPFRYENWLFMHNGYLKDFHKVKRDLTFAVDPSLYPRIMGTTDSEALFHLALTLGLVDDPVDAMAKAIRMVEEVGHDHGIDFPMQGTIAISDGATVWAFRYSTQGRSRTLFHSADMGTLQEMYPDIERLRSFGKRARVIVSEPLNDLPGLFLEVPESSVSVLDASGYSTEPFLQS
ncbi:class II glutamine amidotransferase [Diaminobutyricibacter tongyongensis]|uniref:Class II glutamine amidotransferase n=1 Tax=Leifsonia tongyongensis TaxID=1268043 RepID=A0A6L9XVP6_9MICO|nr:class II glutamine amidotransferase [Diaminobutyricibacter tongyongensis]NEN05510.1 class II glutamine amidotransferase [Diaminobutyricibacter tongyongensis]